MASLTVPEFCELVARRFGLKPDGGKMTVEMIFQGTTFQRAHMHAGPFGLDDLEGMNTPDTVEEEPDATRD